METILKPKKKDTFGSQNDLLRSYGKKDLCSVRVEFWDIGTGGISDLEYWKNKQKIGYPSPFIRDYQSVPRILKFSPSDKLKLIRETLKSTASELATTFHVSRQTIYNWIRGEEPKPDHAKKLEELAHASEILNEAGLAGNGLLLKRKIADGKNLLNIVEESGSGTEAAQKLIYILRTESSQRERLQRRLSERKLALVNKDDLGVPMLDERG